MAKAHQDNDTIDKAKAYDEMLEKRRAARKAYAEKLGVEEMRRRSRAYEQRRRERLMKDPEKLAKHRARIKDAVERYNAARKPDISERQREARTRFRDKLGEEERLRRSREYERRRKERLLADPVAMEARKARSRESSRRYREKKKAEAVVEN